MIRAHLAERNLSIDIVLEVKLRYAKKVWVGRKQEDKKKCIYLRFWAIEKRKGKKTTNEWELKESTLWQI